MAGMMNTPGEAAERILRKGCAKVSWRAFALTLLAFAALGWGVYTYLRITNARVNASEAANNARQISIALGEFDDDFGRFPDTSTALAVKKKTGTPLDFKFGSSNELLCQLIENGRMLEKPFFVSINGTHKVDNVFLPGKALEPGECGFSYIAGLSSQSPPEAPLLITPLIPGSTRFDPKPFNGKALILRVDGAILFPELDRAGQVMIGGKDPFDPSQPFWKGEAPDIKWHEPDPNFAR
jgi:hypothetical protein